MKVPSFSATLKVNEATLLPFMVKKYFNVATCLWEADSIDVLDSYLRSKVGDTSKETYYEVNTANAIGLAL